MLNLGQGQSISTQSYQPFPHRFNILRDNRRLSELLTPLANRFQQQFPNSSVSQGHTAIPAEVNHLQRATGLGALPEQQEPRVEFSSISGWADNAMNRKNSPISHNPFRTGGSRQGITSPILVHQKIPSANPGNSGGRGSSGSSSHGGHHPYALGNPFSRGLPGNGGNVPPGNRRNDPPGNGVKRKNCFTRGPPNVTLIGCFSSNRFSTLRGGFY
jgi:hypothetical protein